MTESRELLAQYAKTGAEAAFGELVTRYVNLVYSTALRLVGGDTQMAEDVTQTVFIDLAAMGKTLSKDVMLGGWLHQHAFHVATTAARSERRRKARESEASEMNMLQNNSEAGLGDAAPLLDEAITQLPSEDRTAILLRFFEERGFRSVGEVLGTSEDAARMRVRRAVEKLHGSRSCDRRTRGPGSEPFCDYSCGCRGRWRSSINSPQTRSYDQTQSCDLRCDHNRRSGNTLSDPLSSSNQAAR